MRAEAWLEVLRSSKWVREPPLSQTFREKSEENYVAFRVFPLWLWDILRLLFIGAEFIPTLDEITFVISTIIAATDVIAGHADLRALCTKFSSFDTQWTSGQVVSLIHETRSVPNYVSQEFRRFLESDNDRLRCKMPNAYTGLPSLDTVSRNR